MLIYCIYAIRCAMWIFFYEREQYELRDCAEKRDIHTEIKDRSVSNNDTKDTKHKDGFAFKLVLKNGTHVSNYKLITSSWWVFASLQLEDFINHADTLLCTLLLTTKRDILTSCDVLLKTFWRLNLSSFRYWNLFGLIGKYMLTHCVHHSLHSIIHMRIMNK